MSYEREPIVILLIKALLLLAIFIVIAPFLVIFYFIKERLTNAFKGEKSK
jgi:hypothetical protein